MSPGKMTWTLARGGSEEHQHSIPIAQVTAWTREQAIAAFAKQIARGLAPPRKRA